MGADESVRPPKLSNFRRSAAGKALFHGSDAAAPEDPPEAGGMTSAVEISIRVENGPRSRAKEVKPSSWKWLSMMMRSATRRVRAFQMAHSVADQICPLSCSSAFAP